MSLMEDGANQSFGQGAAAAVAEPIAADETTIDRSAKIAIIDDEELNIVIVQRHLELDGYRNCIGMSDPAAAIAMLRQEHPDVLLLDIMMPTINGLDVLKIIKQDPALRRIQVIILTAATDVETKLRALELGAADFLSKPVEKSDLLPRVRSAVTIKQYIDRMETHSKTLKADVLLRTAELARSREEAIHCLARASEYRDDDTGQHVVRVGKYARVIATRLSWADEQLNMLEQAAQLHDVGKIGIPDAILLKPGKLTPEEFEVMQRHCGFGKKILRRMPDNEWNSLKKHPELGESILGNAESPVLQMARRISLTHHEKWDGTGYPLGLVGVEIPIEGRITAVADVFDALSSKRPYKEAFPLDKCFAILEEGRGKHFDPDCLAAFFAARQEILEIRIDFADTE